VPDDPKPTENKQASKEPAETEAILEQLRKSGESVLASQPTPPEASKAVPKVPTTKISLSPTEELTAHPPKPGFVRYYWTCLKHFGSRAWETKGAELVSGIVLAFAAFGASLLFSEEGADRAFEIALVSLAGWLAVFALGHLIRTPWLVHRDIRFFATPRCEKSIAKILSLVAVTSIWRALSATMPPSVTLPKHCSDQTTLRIHSFSMLRNRNRPRRLPLPINRR
jgi:hypothetical protein